MGRPDRRSSLVPLLISLILGMAQWTWAQSPPPGEASEATAIPGADPFINRHYQDARYDRWVEIFERPGREVFDQRFRIVHEADIHPGMRIADIGAGTGLFTVLLARAAGPEGRVYAVDTAPSFIAGIEERAAEYRVQNIVPLVNSQSSTDLEPQSIDLAFVCDTYHHFEDPAAMLESIHQSLVPYGRLIIIDFLRRPDLSTPWVMGHVRADREQVIREVESAGFRLIGEPAFLEHSFFLRFQRRETDSEVEVGPVEAASAPE